MTSREKLLSSFHLNGHKLGFHPQTQKIEPPCTAYDNTHHNMKVLLSSFHLNGHTLGFHPKAQKLELLCTA